MMYVMIGFAVGFVIDMLKTYITVKRNRKNAVYDPTTKCWHKV